MRKLFILIAIFAIATGATAQLKILPNGNVGIKTNNPTDPLDVAGRFKIRNDGVVSINAETQDWWPAIRTTVPTKKSCAYNLWNSHKDINRDVFYVCGEGWLWAEKGGYFGSDSTLKKNIAPIEGALKKVISLQGVRFQYKDGSDEEDDFRLGFIANDVEQVFPEAVKEIHDGIKAMSYTDLIAVLVEAIKEQQVIIENLQQEVESQRDILNSCCGTIPQKSMKDEENNTIQQFNLTDLIDANAEEMKVYQNAPNPFNVHTTIQCYVPQNIKKAELCVYNMQGAQVKCITVSERGMFTVQIQAGQLTAGVYTYLLIGDGKTSDAKQMILTK